MIFYTKINTKDFKKVLYRSNASEIFEDNQVHEPVISCSEDGDTWIYVGKNFTYLDSF